MTALSLLSGRAASATTNCVGLEVQTAEHDDSSTLLRVDTSTGARTELATLGYRIDAIGYASQQNLVYGIAAGENGRWFGDGGHLVSISQQGALVDLGPVRGASGGLSDAHAGAVIGSQLYLRAGELLYSVDIDPNSSGFRSVQRVVPLSPGWLADGIGGVDLDTANGLLYGVAAGDPWHASVASIDPNSGAVREVQSLQGLPTLTSYGSVVLAGQIMYAVADNAGGRGRLYRIPLDGSGPPSEVATWPAADRTDMAGCLGTPTTPTTTTTVPAPPLSSPAPVPGRPNLPQVRPSPASIVAPTQPDGGVATPPTPPTPAALVPVPPTTRTSPFPLPAARTIATVAPVQRTIQRDWALTTVLIIVGGGAVAARRSAARARRDGQ